MKPLLITLVLLSMTGCTNTLEILQAVDYGCANIEVDGYFSDSGVTGRAIKLPEGETLTPETVEALCQ